MNTNRGNLPEPFKSDHKIDSDEYKIELSEYNRQVCKSINMQTSDLCTSLVNGERYQAITTMANILQIMVELSGPNNIHFMLEVERARQNNFPLEEVATTGDQV